MARRTQQQKKQEARRQKPLKQRRHGGGRRTLALHDSKTMAWKDPSASENLAIGKRVRDARKSLGIRQQQLASWMGVTQASVCQLETGKRTWKVDSLMVTALALHIPVCHLDPEYTVTGDLGKALSFFPTLGSSLREILDLLQQQESDKACKRLEVLSAALGRVATTLSAFAPRTAEPAQGVLLQTIKAGE